LAKGHIPSHVTTVHDDVVTCERVRQTGAVPFHKPFESTAILAAIGGMIGRDLDPSGA
jgi:FixJ family two-component response regulator